MATTIGVLKTVLTLNSAKFTKGMTKAKSSLKSFEKRANQTKKALFSLKGAIGAAGAAFVTREIIQSINTYQGLSNRLKLVTKDAEELASVQQQLFNIAQKSRAPLEASADLYFRFAKSTTELGLSQKQLISVTETVNKAVAISGTTAQAASAALFQLGQGLAAGALRGQELNSVLEQTPRVAQAIAEGMGVTIGELRELGAQGKITAAQVISAFQSQAEVIESEFAQTEKTISQAMTQIENVWLQTIGSIDATRMVEAMDDFRAAIQDPAVMVGLQNIAGAIIDITTGLVKAAAAFADFSVKVGQGFAILTGGRVLDNVVAIDERMGELGEKITTIHRQAGKNALGIFDVAQIKEYTDELFRLNALREMIAGGGAGDEGADGDPKIPGIVPAAALDEALARQFEKLRASTLSEEQLLEEHFGKNLELIEATIGDEVSRQEEKYLLIEALRKKHDAKLLTLEMAKAKKSEAIERALSKSVVDSKKWVVDNAINFLSVLGQKNKAFAIAALILQKAKAIQEILVQKEVMTAATIASTSAAAMHAMAVLGPIAGPPAAAAIVSQGAAAVAAIQAGALMGVAGVVISGAMGIAEILGNEKSEAISTISVDAATGLPEDAVDIGGGFATPEATQTLVFNFQILGDPSDETMDTIIDRMGERFGDGKEMRVVNIQ